VSEDYTQGQPFPPGTPHAAQGASAELQTILDRVKDERLRLLRLLKDCETRFGTAGVVPPAEEIARLTGKVRAIDEAVRNRYEQLRHDETVLEKRAYQIDQLQECVQGLADQINIQIEQARTFTPELAAAKQAVKDAMQQIVSDARSQLDLLRDNVTDRIGEYRHAQTSGQEQLRETRKEIEKTFTDIDSRLAAAAGLARDEAQKLIDPIFGQLENHATDCGQRIQQLIEAADNTVREKLEALPAQAQKTLEPTREILNTVISDAREQITSVNDAIKSLDDRLNGLADQAEGIVEIQLDSISTRAEQVLDGFLDKRLREQDELLDQRFQQQQQAFEQREQAMNKRLQNLMLDKQAKLIVVLDEQAAGLTDRLLSQHSEKIEKSIAGRIDSVLSDAQDRAQGTAEQLHRQLSASLDQSHAEAIEATRKIEAEARDISHKADRQADAVARAIESSMREHVVEAMSRADAITDPFKARLQDALANHRELAEEYSQTAEVELSEKAKAHWDAFRKDTQAALDKQKQALEVQAQNTIQATQQNMKQRVQDMCASSQSMVDLIEQQLARKLKGVQPQAQQAIEVIEKQTGERLSQLRENAQSMVQLIEDQLSKRVAELQPKAVSAAREAEQELNEHMDRVREEVENVIVPLRRQAIEELGQIADVGKSIRGAIRRDATQDVGSTEPPVVNASKLTTPLQEMAARMGKKAAKLVGTRKENEQIPGQNKDQDNTGDERKAA
jgi:ElaB/YqjD/DUF883 family membrane-anchored ribosome-binding protein